MAVPMTVAVLHTLPAIGAFHPYDMAMTMAVPDTIDRAEATIIATAEINGDTGFMAGFGVVNACPHAHTKRQNGTQNHHCLADHVEIPFFKAFNAGPLPS
jgi:hypothetical protein